MSATKFVVTVGSGKDAYVIDTKIIEPDNEGSLAGKTLIHTVTFNISLDEDPTRTPYYSMVDGSRDDAKNTTPARLDS